MRALARGREAPPSTVARSGGASRSAAISTIRPPCSGHAGGAHRLPRGRRERDVPARPGADAARERRGLGGRGARGRGRQGRAGRPHLVGRHDRRGQPASIGREDTPHRGAFLSQYERSKLLGRAQGPRARRAELGVAGRLREPVVGAGAGTHRRVRPLAPRPRERSPSGAGGHLALGRRRRRLHRGARAAPSATARPGERYLINGASIRGERRGRPAAAASAGSPRRVRFAPRRWSPRRGRGCGRPARAWWRENHRLPRDASARCCTATATTDRWPSASSVCATRRSRSTVRRTLDLVRGTGLAPRRDREPDPATGA